MEKTEILTQIIANGFYYKDNGEIYQAFVYSVRENGIIANTCGIKAKGVVKCTIFYYKDYGRTWAISEGELK